MIRQIFSFLPDFSEDLHQNELIPKTEDSPDIADLKVIQRKPVQSNH